MAEENEKINEKIEDLKEEVKETIDEIKEDVQGLKEEKAEKKEEFQAKVGEVKEDAKEAFAKAKEKAQATADKIKAEVDDYTEEIDPEDIEKNKPMAILAYLGFLVFIPIFAAKDSKFARFHANQGLILFLIEFILIWFTRVKVLGWLFNLLELVVWLLAIVGIVYVVQGKAKELPVIGNWKILK